MGIEKLQEHRNPNLSGRYITLYHLEPIFSSWSGKIERKTIGYSVHKKPIDLFKIGNGSKKLFFWSQMHGNETTTTKAMVDFIDFLLSYSPESLAILRTCRLYFIFVLNPDGAEFYNRLNSNNIDLNRDALNLSQPESKALKTAFDTIQPNYCFNMHDQRTIFNTGITNIPATISFLAPAADHKKSITSSRKIAMQLITAINHGLQKYIPNGVGLYQDTFNLNCVGDRFQSFGVPTVLFEAGHYPEDYERETTRMLIFYAILRVCKMVANDSWKKFDISTYSQIPKNNTLFYDIILKNPYVISHLYKKEDQIGILFRECLEKNRIMLIPEIQKVGKLDSYFGHIVYNCKQLKDLQKIKNFKGLFSFISKDL